MEDMCFLQTDWDSEDLGNLSVSCLLSPGERDFFEFEIKYFGVPLTRLK